MNGKVKYVEEFPDKNYISELGGTDFDFERQFTVLLKREFASQLGLYLYHIKKDEPRAAAEVVNKIKYKFSILGMKNAFKFSEYYEEQLHVGDMELDEDFKKYLRKVNEFLKTL